jgi:prepilin-type N-terminal cleavage/methylation domain-containing protein
MVMDSKNILNNSGFTLVEMVIATSIFAILAVLISGIFLQMTEVQRQTANYQRLQNDGRYILEKLAKEIRAREIDYPLSSNANSGLNFQKDEYGEQASVCYASSTGSLKYFVSERDRNISTGDISNVCSSEGSDLNAKDIEVSYVDFYVTPTTEELWADPASFNSQQPRVTMVLKLRNRGLSSGKAQELFLQTTISSKVYNR